MNLRQAIVPHHEILAPATLLRHAWQLCRDAFARWQERQRLIGELTDLDPRVMSELMLQPHDVVQLMRGRTTPAAADRIQLMRHRR